MKNQFSRPPKRFGRTFFAGVVKVSTPAALISAAAAAIRAAGVDTFLTPEKVVVPGLFGGLENWFFTGPSGEQIELLHML